MNNRVINLWPFLHNIFKKQTKKIGILQLSKHCFSVMSNTPVKAVIIDLSGTVHIEDTPIAGSQQALEKLRTANLKVKFVTNTTKEPLRTLHERLLRLGFCVRKEEIFTSLTAASNLVAQRKLRPLLLLEDVAKEDFSGFDESSPNAVVIGLAPSCFNYEQMNTAFRLMLEGAPLIAIHKARYYKKADGLLHLGPGPFVTGLEFAMDTKAEVVGKPEKAFFVEAIKDLGVEPEQAVMIGDDIRGDVEGAMQAGMQGILVKTGKYRTGDEDKISPQATAVCEDFPKAVDYILSL